MHVERIYLTSLSKRKLEFNTYLKFDEDSQEMRDWSRFAKLAKLGESDACWEWQGNKPDGYGYIVINGKRVPSHRYSYETLVGPIPDRLVIDHLCRNRPCWRPDHLDPVTRGVNSLRGVGAPARNFRKAECNNGHLFSIGNTRLQYKKDGIRRECITCRKEYKRLELRKNKDKRNTQ